MEEEKKHLEDVILIRLVRLNAVVQGVATGLIVGLGIFLATNWLVLKGGPVVGPHMRLLDQFFPGYDVTFFGSLLGFTYGFGTGFVAGYLVAAVYNRVADARERGRGGAGR
jgi:hypothetical protein